MKSKFLHHLFTDTAAISLGDKFRAALAVFISIVSVGALSAQMLAGPGLPWMVASMGATAILVFGASHGPMAQPWPLVMGHLVSIVIGVSCARFIPDAFVAAALAVSGSIMAMYLLRCLHPPGGAAALLPVLGGESVQAMGYQLVLMPVMLNVFTMLVLAVVLNRLILRGNYPARAIPAGDIVHRHDDPTPLARLGVNREDLRRALSELDTYVDISEADLAHIVRRADGYANQRRMGALCCADIMSRDLVTVEYSTELEEVWALLRAHKIATLPVIDHNRRVLGMVSLVDILKRADLERYDTFQTRLGKFLRRTPGLTTDKPEVAGHIMAKPAITIGMDAHILELVPMFSDRGLHHLPVVDERKGLVGMVTQSDLIAALYHHCSEEPEPRVGNELTPFQ